MSNARKLADLLDSTGDVKSGALDNVPASNNASALTTGTLPDGRFPATLPAISGASLTSLPSQTANDFTNTLKTKLDAIEASATADQTKSDIEGLGIAASSITGALPAISGANLTGISTTTDFASLTDTTVSTSDPTVSTNPSATGHLWVNKTSGESYVCRDITSGANEWYSQRGNHVGITMVTLDDVEQSTFVDGTNISLTTTGTYTFKATGAITVKVQMWGAGGGGAMDATTNDSGAAGGFAKGNVSITANADYTIIVGEGGGGTDNTAGDPSTSSSFPDGGISLNDGNLQGGGGGSSRFGKASDINGTNDSSSVYLLIAGGGAGGSSNGSGGTRKGWGGGTSGADGGDYYPSGEGSGSPGGGGSQTAGGSAGSGGRQSPGGAGGKYAGGNGAGSGGGGGYYGGGGAHGYYAKGGGGSGYLHSSVTSSGFLTTSTSNGWHTAPDDDDGNASPSSAGNGGTGHTVGYDGAVVISFVS